jgi:hypothetical protein
MQTPVARASRINGCGSFVLRRCSRCRLLRGACGRAAAPCTRVVSRQRVAARRDVAITPPPPPPPPPRLPLPATTHQGADAARVCHVMPPSAWRRRTVRSRRQLAARGGTPRQRRHRRRRCQPRYAASRARSAAVAALCSVEVLLPPLRQPATPLLPPAISPDVSRVPQQAAVGRRGRERALSSTEDACGARLVSIAAARAATTSQDGGACGVASRCNLHTLSLSRHQLNFHIPGSFMSCLLMTTDSQQRRIPFHSPLLRERRPRHQTKTTRIKSSTQSLSGSLRTPNTTPNNKTPRIPQLKKK